MAYGSRTGVTTLKRYVKLLCNLYNTFKSKIDAWVRANTAEPTTSTALAGLQAIVALCAIIEGLPDD